MKAQNINFCLVILRDFYNDKQPQHDHVKTGSIFFQLCTVQVRMVAKKQIQTSILSSLLVALNKQNTELRLISKTEYIYF